MPVRKVLNHRTAKPRAAGISAAGLLAVASSFAVLAGGCRAPPHAEITTPPLVRMREFHGHLGPYVVLGYRMGEAARRALASPGYFDLRARVESPLAPPASCLIDGVQLGSGCTVGKRNLAVEEGKIARAVFDSRSGKRAAIALRPELPERIRERIAAVGVEAAGMEVFGAPDGDLFTIETGEAR